MFTVTCNKLDDERVRSYAIIIYSLSSNIRKCK